MLIVDFSPQDEAVIRKLLSERRRIELILKTLTILRRGQPSYGGKSSDSSNDWVVEIPAP